LRVVQKERNLSGYLERIPYGERREQLAAKK
jgi:hypothetical protein